MRVSINFMGETAGTAIAGGVPSNITISSSRKMEKRVKKHLNYNYREISGKLLKAGRVQSAAIVLACAKSKLSVLQSSAASGQYEQKEVENAIAHARSMIRCAQMKMRNLRAEEQEQKNHGRKNGSEEQQKRNEAKLRAVQSARRIKDEIEMEQLQQTRQERGRQQEIIRKRRMHRTEELEKIKEADMKYMKDQGGLSGFSPRVDMIDQAVFLELSVSAAILTEEQIAQQAQEEAGGIDAADREEMYNTCSGAENVVSTADIVGVQAAETIDISI